MFFRLRVLVVLGCCVLSACGGGGSSSGFGTPRQDFGGGIANAPDNPVSPPSQEPPEPEPGSEPTPIPLPAGATPVIAYIDYDPEGNSDLMVMNVDGTSPAVLLPGLRDSGFGFEYATWSPDGQEIAYVGLFGLGLHRVDIDDAAFNAFFVNGYIFGTPSWRAQGDWIAFTSEDTPNDLDVQLVSPNGGSIVNLTINFPGADENDINFEPDWSYDGSRILFKRFRGGSTDLSEIFICEFSDATSPVPCAYPATPWRSAWEISNAIWHPDPDADVLLGTDFEDQEIIAYKSHNNETDFNDRRLNIFIESEQRDGSGNPLACVHLYNDRLGMINVSGVRPDCVVKKSVGDFYFRRSFDWSCDGSELIVEGHFDSPGSWGIYRIPDIFGSASTLTPQALSRTVDQFEDGPASPASRRGCL